MKNIIYKKNTLDKFFATSFFTTETSHSKKSSTLTCSITGSVILEFAIVFPIFITIILGIIQFGLYINAKHILSIAAEQGLNMAKTIPSLDKDARFLPAQVGSGTALPILWSESDFYPTDPDISFQVVQEARRRVQWKAEHVAVNSGIINPPTATSGIRLLKVGYSDIVDRTVTNPTPGQFINTSGFARCDEEYTATPNPTPPFRAVTTTTPDALKIDPDTAPGQLSAAVLMPGQCAYYTDASGNQKWIKHNDIKLQTEFPQNKLLSNYPIVVELRAVVPSLVPFVSDFEISARAEGYRSKIPPRPFSVEEEAGSDIIANETGTTTMPFISTPIESISDVAMNAPLEGVCPDLDGTGIRNWAWLWNYSSPSPIGIGIPTILTSFLDLDPNGCQGQDAIEINSFYQANLYDHND